jgi:leader peptidase (prepilin peptidase)/N-methyltransferase
LFVVVAQAIGASWALPAFLYVAAVGMALAVIDWDTKRLPNALTLPSYPVLAGLLLLAAGLDSDWAELVRALLGGLLLFIAYFLLALIYPAGMGLGDVKLSGVLGMALGWLGWSALVVGSLAAFVLASVVGLALMVGGRAGRRTLIPFGPFMLAGALVGMLWGEQVADWYISRL